MLLIYAATVGCTDCGPDHRHQLVEACVEGSQLRIVDAIAAAVVPTAHRSDRRIHALTRLVRRGEMQDTTAGQIEHD
jgi:hypothetical protein